MAHAEPFASPLSYEQLRVARVRELYPELGTEGDLVDPERLHGLLPGEAVDSGPERYGLSWNGKRAAQQALSLGPSGTLHPCPEESLDWETTRNVYIEGENLETLRIFLKPYFRKVKTMYIDPPYNTGGDFIYKDHYAAPVADYLAKTGQTDEAGNLLVSNPETSGRYHSDWLTMMYPRLALARELLREDGVLFCSIDDHEVHNLRLLLNEVFGEENFVGTIVWQRSKRGDSKLIADTHEYALVIARSRPALLERESWRLEKPGAAGVLAQYNQFKRQYSSNHDAISQAMRAWYGTLAREDDRVQHRHYQWSDARGLYFAADFAGPDDGRTSRPRYDIIHPVTGKPCKKPSTGWRWDQARTQRALEASPPLIHFGPDETTIPCRKTYLVDTSATPYASVFYRDGRAATLELEALVGAGLLDFPKSVDVLVDWLRLGSASGDLVLDFFSGSATTAHAVMDLNNADGGDRRYIMVQLPEPTGREDYPTIADIGKERIRRVAARIREERAGKLDLEQRDTPLDLGMRVFKLSASTLAPSSLADAAVEAGSSYLSALQGSLDTLLPDWRPDDLLWEVLLREGLPLDCRVETLTVGPQTVYRATDIDTERRLYVCLDPTITDEPLVALLEHEPDAALVCRESALADDAVAQNLALHCRLVTL